MIEELDLTDLSREAGQYQEKVNQNPNDHQAWFMLAQVYQRQQKLDNAKVIYKKALELEKRPEYHLRLGELCFNTFDYDSALLHLLESTKLADEGWKHQELADDLIQQIYEYDSC